ncbi:MAG: carboxymuconolactone decarboxylase family protein [Pseudomonadota bacterium]
MSATHPMLHTPETAPEGSKPLLEGSVKAFGMIPNLHAVMAESPAHLEAYQSLHSLVVGKSAFDATERTVVWMTINVEHACHYCVPAHTTIAQMDKVDAGIVEALRTARTLADAKLEALRQFTLKVLRERGRVTAADLEAFKAAGYTDAHVLDVVLVLAQKVMSNYVNHIYETPVDAPFQKNAWNPADAGKAA